VKVTLYYVHDPMCSWCWAFRPSLNSLLENLPDEIALVRLLGGLAPDSNVPMTDEIRAYVQQNWRAIEQQVPETRFNYDFWTACTPRRSTYSACRAVIAARTLDKKYDTEMTFAIQQAYYLQARNPSDHAILIELAEELGLNRKKFTEVFHSPETEETLRQEIKQSRRLGLNSFPSLMLANGDIQTRIEIDYLNAETMLKKINQYY
jgi:putative protein-disulfide isomerase